ncbi:MAG: hypothetical protein H0X08_03125 [Blastocatellia bacterium]|nr:hypothetical protein [Blastocatellia bacterium]
MLKSPALFIFFISVVVSLGCGGTAPTNSTKTSSNANIAVTLDNVNLPAGLSASPLQMSNAQTPGFPANAKAITRGTTPTPGIPSEAELKKAFKPGATPTPGMPSPEEMRRQANMQGGNVNAPAGSPDPRPMKGTTRKP